MRTLRGWDSAIWTDSCVVCLRATDTGLAFSGDRQFVEAALTLLGLRRGRASALMASGVRRTAPCDGADEVVLRVRLCGHCAAATRPRLMIGDWRHDLPTYRQGRPRCDEGRETRRLRRHGG